MRSKLLFFVLVLLSLLLLPFGVKSRPEEKNFLKKKSLENLVPTEVRDELKGSSIDTDYLNKSMA